MIRTTAPSLLQKSNFPNSNLPSKRQRGRQFENLTLVHNLTRNSSAKTQDEENCPTLLQLYCRLTNPFFWLCSFNTRADSGEAFSLASGGSWIFIWGQSCARSKQKKRKKNPWLRQTDALCINTIHDPFVQIYSRARPGCAKHGVHKQVLQCMTSSLLSSFFTHNTIHYAVKWWILILSRSCQ